MSQLMPKQYETYTTSQKFGHFFSFVLITIEIDNASKLRIKTWNYVENIIPFVIQNGHLS